MRVGIIGSRQYENKRKIKETIFKLKNKFANKLVIVSGGTKDGADRYAKKYALELDCQYLEFNPSHTIKNLYSALHENYYNQPYSVKNFFTRNTMLAKYCDIIIGFVPDSDEARGTKHTISEAKKFDKKIVVIS